MSLNGKTYVAMSYHILYSQQQEQGIHNVSTILTAVDLLRIAEYAESVVYFLQSQHE